MNKPNIIYFVADQMRSDSLHHLGNPASHTPHLDNLALEGVSFENAYCQNPVCVPSRCSFLTGLYPHTTGHRTMHYLQDDNEPNILKTMKKNGYEVIWIGRNDIYPSNKSKIEFCDEYYDGIDSNNRVEETTASPMHFSLNADADTNKDGYYSFYIGKTDKEMNMGSMDDGAVKSAIDYLQRKSTSGNDKPFFLYVTLFFPHPPYGCGEPFYGLTDRNGLLQRRPNVSTLHDKPSMLQGIHQKQNLAHWSEEKWNELRATYLDMVAKFDHDFGRLKEALVNTGLYDDSSIFVFSDHGDYTGDYGIVEKAQNCFEDPISNVPLIVKPAKGFEVSPRCSKALVELVDLSATIADMAQIKLDYTQFGKSLLNAIAGSEIHKDAVICEGGRIHGEEHCMEKGHPPISPYWPRLSTQCSEGPEHTKATMIRMGNFKYTKRLYEKDELYNLDQDPYELDNKIDDPTCQDQIRMMKERLLDLYQETCDVVPIRKDKR